MGTERGRGRRAEGEQMDFLRSATRSYHSEIFFLILHRDIFLLMLQANLSRAFPRDLDASGTRLWLHHGYCFVD